VVGILRGQQAEVPAVEPDAVEMAEVRITAFLPAYSQEIDRPVLFVDAQQPVDVAFAGRDPVFRRPVSRS